MFSRSLNAGATIEIVGTKGDRGVAQKGSAISRNSEKPVLGPGVSRLVGFWGAAVFENVVTTIYPLLIPTPTGANAATFVDIQVLGWCAATPHSDTRFSKTAS
jgi:hypothetical protein